ncbi:MAG: hypothetical protein EOM20_00355 [Spartobacteria bacterium]|nr:hypothetical protein [Spartobacteria bacterium]
MADTEPRKEDENRYSDASPLWVEGGEKYVIERLLARGGMGAVYEAHDLKCERSVALKVMETQKAKDPTDVKRFEGEARITSGLEHPNIVPIHELARDREGNLFYAMKHVKGIPLADVLVGLRDANEEMVREFPLSRLLTIFQKVCDAVAFAHSRGVAHCDLKPANIMIGSYGEVLVLDWGLAKPIEHLEDEPVLSELMEHAVGSIDAIDVEDLHEHFRKQTLYLGIDALAPGAERPGTQDIPVLRCLQDTMQVELVGLGNTRTGVKTGSGTIMGTPGYLAPELICTGGRGYNERTDIYALGAILYCMLTLEPPIKGDDLKDLLRRALYGDIRSPASFNGPSPMADRQRRPDDVAVEYPLPLPHCPGGRIPPYLSDLAMKALAYEPSHRFSLVKEMQRHLEDYQNGIIWHLIAEEDFSDDAVFSRWDVLGGKHERRNGELRVWGGEPQVLMFKRDLPGDLRIEFECYLEGSYLNDVGCFLGAVRSEDPWAVSVSGYAFKYGAYTNSYNVLTRLDKRLWSQADAPLVRSQPYHVCVDRIGRELRMSVNGRELFAVIDHEPLVGAHRGAVGVLGWVADTRYRRLRLYSLGTPWKSDILDVAERHLEKGRYETAIDLFQDALDSFPDAERIERGRVGLKQATQCKELLDRMPEWKARLARAWPGVVVGLRVDRNGLTVELPRADIDSLEPLAGMPISALHCTVNRITTLEPLAGMPLRILDCSGNPIRGLDPLRGMELHMLLCEHCCITTLAPLRGMPIRTLNCAMNPLEDGLEPLRGMQLIWLNCARTGSRRLDPLRGMPMTLLFCDGNGISDLSPLKGMPLTELICSGNAIEDLEPLRGMPLINLNCASNAIISLEPLADMPLSTMRCQNNRIEKLDALKEMPLNYLLCGANRLRSIGPLIKNPPRHFAFECDTITMDELEWIRKPWARDFRFAEYAREVEVLLAVRRRDVAALKHLAAEFDGHRYLYIPRPMLWDDARGLCEELGGYLVTVRRREVNDFIQSLFPWGGSWFWMGLITGDHGHAWISGDPVTFISFCHVLDERLPGPKLYASGKWRGEVIPNACNCFMIEWDG